jgi:hypothetical protein
MHVWLLPIPIAGGGTRVLYLSFTETTMQENRRK